MRYWKTLLFPFFLFLLVHNIFSQNIELSKTTIHPNEEFSISITFPSDSKKYFQSFLFPEIQGFAKFITRSERISVTEENESGKQGYMLSQSYIPLKTGTFKMHALEISMGEKELSIPETVITVLSGPIPKRKTPVEFENAHFKQEKEELYFTISIDKNMVYTGEGFTLTASLLVGENNKTAFNFFNLTTQLLSISRMLTTSNCMIDKHSRGMIEAPQFDSIRSGSKAYQRLKLFEAKVYPVNAQNITFPASEFKLLKYTTATTQNEILWKAEEVVLTSRPLQVKVKELPEHPLREKIAVGTFRAKEHISSGNVQTGKNFRYAFMISGNGNLATVLPPDIQGNENFDFYSPVTSQQTIHKEEYKVFTFSIVPKEPGKYRLADYFYWVHFDPSKNQYDTLRSRINLTVTGESQKNKEISSTDLGSFYELAGEESNRLRSYEKDQSIKFFANIIILFMLVTTAILIFRR